MWFLISVLKDEWGNSLGRKETKGISPSGVNSMYKFSEPLDKRVFGNSMHLWEFLVQRIRIGEKRWRGVKMNLRESWVRSWESFMPGSFNSIWRHHGSGWASKYHRQGVTWLHYILKMKDPTMALWGRI